MKVRNLIVPGILAVAVCGAVNARSISYDSGQYNFSSSPAPLTVDGYALSFAPGTTSYAVMGGASNLATPPLSWEYNWGPNPTGFNGGDILEQVLVSQTSLSAFEVDFNYFSGSCTSETATLMLGGTAYSAKNPCAANQLSTANAFKVTNGTVNAPTGWVPASTVAAPEMDPNSAVSALTLLLGSVAVLVGRRKPQRVVIRA